MSEEDTRKEVIKIIFKIIELLPTKVHSMTGHMECSTCSVALRRRFVIRRFVIRRFVIRGFVIRRFVIRRFVIRRFVIRCFVIRRFVAQSYWLYFPRKDFGKTWISHF